MNVCIAVFTCYIRQNGTSSEYLFTITVAWTIIKKKIQVNKNLVLYFFY